MIYPLVITSCHQEAVVGIFLSCLKRKYGNIARCSDIVNIAAFVLDQRRQGNL